MDEDLSRKITRFALWGVLALGLTTTTCASFARVDEGFRGVRLTFGAAAAEPLDPGLHIKMPFVTKIRQLDVKQRKFKQATMASTADQQMVNTTVAINYRATAQDTVTIYSQLGQDPEQWEQTVFAPHIQEVLKSVTAHYTALELITRRPEVKDEITEALISRIADEHFTIEQVSITNFAFSEKYMAAIEAKQVAEQEAQRARNELERNGLDVQKVEQQAEAEKNAAIAKAEGEAEALRIRAQAEADFHRIISETATPASLRNRELTRWDGKAPLYVGGGASLMLPGVPDEG